MQFSVLITLIAAAASVSAAPWQFKHHPKVIKIDATIINTAQNCGNNQAVYCCDSKVSKNSCAAIGKNDATETQCTGGATVCCSQNANDNDLQLCMAQLIVGHDVNISIG
jgi:hypothetical protein